MARRQGHGRPVSDRLLAPGLVFLALVVGAFVSSLVYRWTGPGAPEREPPAGARVAAAGVRGAAPAIDRGRIRVEVLNATRIPGLADRMTEFLRARGFDVVSYDNAAARADSSRVVDRVGNAAFAREVALALPGTEIRRQLSEDRFVDVTVVVGADYPRYLGGGTASQPGAPPSPGRGPLARLRSVLGL